MTFLISSAAQAADLTMKHAKVSKKEQLRLRERCGPNCTEPPGTHCLLSQFSVIRDGVTEIIFTVDDDWLYTGFSIAARFFSGHIITMLIDERTDAGTRRLLVASADRQRNVEWREAPYDVSAYGLAYGAVGRPARPDGVADTVNEDIIEQMAEKSAEDIVAMMSAVMRRRPDFSMAEVRAATDLATIHMVQDLPICPINTVTLVAMPDSQRLAALREHGIEVMTA